ncbi:MAG: hypothetical protein ACE15C_05920 [Phycisphaerae bacterium]
MMRWLRPQSAFGYPQSSLLLAVVAIMSLASTAGAMDVAIIPAATQPSSTPATGPAKIAKLVLTGSNFRYTWEARRGWELSVVEQPGLLQGGWWNLAEVPRKPTYWQRVNSNFAWKSLDTIPAISFSTRRGAYYSGEWTIAYANADRNAQIKIVKSGKDEVVFETTSNPKILENIRMPVPWQVKQVVRVFDSGVVLTNIEVILPKGEVYELDWSQMSVNMDDWLYKEPHPDRQEIFGFNYAFPGDDTLHGDRWKSHVQEMNHLPLDIDVKLEQCVRTQKPILCAQANYDLTHIQGSAVGGYMECCLEEARSLLGTKDDFGSMALIRQQSGMSPVPTYAGSMRGNVCFSVNWNLFDGKTAGLNEPLTWRNTLAFAVGCRKRSSLPDAAADDRNVLLGARVYYARDKMPAADDVKSMAADGCDTLVLGPAWKADEAAAKAAVAAAHASGIRVGATVDVKDLKTLVADGAWFTKVFEKDRDGLYLVGANCLSNAMGQGEFAVGAEKVSFKRDEAFRANAPSWAVCMRALRATVGPRGFLIGEETGMGPTLLSLAEFDLHAATRYDNYRYDSPQGRCTRRYKGGAGFAPVLDSMTADHIGLAATYADTPIILWPAKDKNHAAWWQLCKRLPAGGSRVESDLLAAERRFTTSSANVHGTLFDSGGGQMILLLAAEKPDAAKVTLTIPNATLAVKTLDGQAVSIAGNVFDAGQFTAWQVKGFEITAAKGGGK